jgi:hypothetical protein
VGCWDRGELWRRMDAGGVKIKERILMFRMVYSVLNE